MAEFITVSAFCLHIHPNSARSTSGLDYLGCHDITLGFTSLWLAVSMWQVHRGKPCLLSELQVSWEVLNITFLFTWSVNRRFDCQTCLLCFSTKDSDTSFRFVDPKIDMILSLINKCDISYMYITYDLLAARLLLTHCCAAAWWLLQSGMESHFYFLVNNLSAGCFILDLITQIGYFFKLEYSWEMVVFFLHVKGALCKVFSLLHLSA